MDSLISKRMRAAPPARAPQGPRIATAVSRRPAGAPLFARGAAPSLLARASLGLLFAMLLPACLVTSSPTFEEPKRTAPFLRAPSAVPALNQITVVDATANMPPAAVFRADVVSEDNGEGVVGKLVLDYGIQTQSGFPYRFSLADADAPSGTLDGPARTMTAKWFPDAPPTTAGCHNVTLLATHKFDVDTGCPSSADDFDFLTWTVIVCDHAPCCDPSLPPEKGGCTTWQCPVVDPGVKCGVAKATPKDYEPHPGAESGGAP
jgi:hypothetical protein